MASSKKRGSPRTQEPRIPPTNHRKYQKKKRSEEQQCSGQPQGRKGRRACRRLSMGISYEGWGQKLLGVKTCSVSRRTRIPFPGPLLPGLKPDWEYLKWQNKMLTGQREYINTYSQLRTSCGVRKRSSPMHLRATD